MMTTIRDADEGKEWTFTPPLSDQLLFRKSCLDLMQLIRTLMSFAFNKAQPAPYLFCTRTESSCIALSLPRYVVNVYIYTTHIIPYVSKACSYAAVQQM